MVYAILDQVHRDRLPLLRRRPTHERVVQAVHQIRNTVKPFPVRMKQRKRRVFALRLDFYNCLSCVLKCFPGDAVHRATDLSLYHPNPYTNTQPERE
jgi:hypothetical protein